jgi:hypothetical protein
MTCVICAKHMRVRSQSTRRVASRRTPEALLQLRDADRKVAEEEGSCDFRLNSGGKPIDCLIKYILPEFSWTPASTLSSGALHRAASVCRSAPRRGVAPAELARNLRQPRLSANIITNESKRWAHMRLLASSQRIAACLVASKFRVSRHPGEASLYLVAACPSSRRGTIVQHIERP